MGEESLETRYLQAQANIQSRSSLCSAPRHSNHSKCMQERRISDVSYSRTWQERYTIYNRIHELRPTESILHERDDERIAKGTSLHLDAIVHLNTTIPSPHKVHFHATALLEAPKPPRFLYVQSYCEKSSLFNPYRVLSTRPQEPDGNRHETTRKIVQALVV